MRIDELFMMASGQRGGRREREILDRFGGGLSAIANLVTTLEEAPSAEISSPRRSYYEKARESLRDPATSYLVAARGRTDTALAKQRALREERQAEAKLRKMAADEGRAQELASQRREQSKKRLEEADSRIETNKRRGEAATKRAEAAGTSRASGRVKSRSGGVRWVDPSTGERYDIERGTWDKSSHTLFDIVVETTRPAPDERGYPSEKEWRRHCQDMYGRSRDQRDTYIIRNLPGNRRALEYLKRIAN